MATVRVKYIIGWETEVEIPEGFNGNIQKYSRNVAVERLHDCLSDGDFITSPYTEVKDVSFTYKGRIFAPGEGWSIEQTRLIASQHGYDRQINQNPFEKTDPRHEVYERDYKAGYNER